MDDDGPCGRILHPMDDDGPRRYSRHQSKHLCLPFRFFFARFSTHVRFNSKGLILLAFPALLPRIRVLL